MDENKVDEQITTLGVVNETQDVPVMENSEISPKKRRLPKYFVAVVAAFFSVVAIGAGVYAKYYMNPQRILNTALVNFLESKSYDYSVLIDVERSPGERNVSLKLSGIQDMQDSENPEARSEIEAYLSSIKVAGIETVTKNKDIYAKLNYLISMGYDIETIKNKWVLVDFNELYKQYLGEELTVLEREEEYSLSDEERIKLIAEISQNPPFEVVNKLEESEIEGVAVVGYSLSFNRENTQALYAYIQEMLYEKVPNYATDTSMEEFSDVFKKLMNDVEFSKFEVWVGKSDKMLHKIDVEMKIKMGVADTVYLGVEAELNRYNEDFEVEIPSEYMKINDFVTEAALILTQQAETGENEFYKLMELLYPTEQ